MFAELGWLALHCAFEGCSEWPNRLSQRSRRRHCRAESGAVDNIGARRRSRSTSPVSWWDRECGLAGPDRRGAGCVEGRLVIGPTGAVRVRVATKPADFRKGAEGLAALVRESMVLITETMLIGLSASRPDH
jgi:hypothetical protein